MIILYRALVGLITPLLPFYLNKRLAKGKEDTHRLPERYGYASLPRPQGKLIWFHAASVGESLSLLKLLETLRQSHPHLTVLVTTGTVTSAQLMAERLPEGVIHQFVPLDVPKWIRHFLNHWQPDLAVFLESELWPNTLREIKNREIPLLLLNARLSDKSFRNWQRFPRTARKLLGQFDLCLTPSATTSERLKQLGAHNVRMCTNLKFTCNPPLYNTEEAIALKKIIEKRKVWAAASTHEGEESLCLDAHLSLRNKSTTQSILTILVPRHPNRTAEVLKLIQERGLTVARRSLEEIPSPNTDIWLIDTLGEMGLVYHLVEIAFIGGSLVPIGGHNPIEAIQLGAVVVHGPFDGNTKDIHEILQPALIALPSAESLASEVRNLLDHPEQCDALKQEGQAILIHQNAGVDDVVDQILELLGERIY